MVYKMCVVYVCAFIMYVIVWEYDVTVLMYKVFDCEVVTALEG